MARNALDFLDDCYAVCQIMTVRVCWWPQSPDGGGNLVIDAAVNGPADAIATFNVRDPLASAARFGITAEPPADILRGIV